MKTLLALAKIEEQHIIDKRIELSNAVNELEQNQRALVQLDAQIIVERDNVAKHPENLDDFDRYVKWSKGEKHRIQQIIHAKQAEIDVLRDIVARHFADKKRYEIVAEQREKQHQKHIQQQENNMIDELATQNYIAYHKDNKH